jgi:hypothetical protein
VAKKDCDLIERARGGGQDNLVSLNTHASIPLKKNVQGLKQFGLM